MSDVFDYGDDAGAGFSAPIPRDCADILLDPIQLDLQLAAIRSLLHRNRAEDARLLAELHEIERVARSRGGRAIDEYGATFYETVYQDGTHALAALGMVAPLTESVLVRLLRHVPTMGTARGPQHARWLADDREHKRWNCKYRWDATTETWCDDIVGGIDQIAKAVDIEAILTKDDRLRIRALFTYRNAMLHNGMEWPEEWAAKFERHTVSWPPDWFDCARRGDRPWIFYMTAAFTDACLALLERFADGIGTMFVNWSKRTGLSFDDLTMPSGG